jgi:hypothetical protein
VQLELLMQKDILLRVALYCYTFGRFSYSQVWPGFAVRAGVHGHCMHAQRLGAAWQRRAGVCAVLCCEMHAGLCSSHTSASEDSRVRFAVKNIWCADPIRTVTSLPD